MACGVWAIVPSILVFVNAIPKPASKTPVMNIFFFYSLIEHTEDAVPKHIDRLLSAGGDLICLLIYGGCIIAYLLFIRRVNSETQVKIESGRIKKN